MKCELCGKIPRWGNNVSHSKRHTKRRWLPNVRIAKFATNGKKKKVAICTRCLRTKYKVTG
ncbi:50S ribosomal protein L28 [Chloroflexota bacterium]